MFFMNGHLMIQERYSFYEGISNNSFFPLKYIIAHRAFLLLSLAAVISCWCNLSSSLTSFITFHLIYAFSAHYRLYFSIVPRSECKLILSFILTNWAGFIIFILHSDKTQPILEPSSSNLYTIRIFNACSHTEDTIFIFIISIFGIVRLVVSIFMTCILFSFTVKLWFFHDDWLFILVLSF